VLRHLRWANTAVAHRQHCHREPEGREAILYIGSHISGRALARR
jgi:hypothetical protein